MPPTTPIRHRRSAPRLAIVRLTAIVCTAVAIGCERSADLPSPRYGSETCAVCTAAIGDPRFSAQYQSSAGAVKSFDDPACLFAALETETDKPTAIRFHAYDRDSWLAPGDVWFARTPATAAHGSGWAAYSSFAAAQDAVSAAGSGELVSFDEAKARVRRETTAR